MLMFQYIQPETLQVQKLYKHKWFFKPWQMQIMYMK